MLNKRLFWSIFLPYLGIIAVLILLFGIGASYELRDLYLEQTSHELESGARAFAQRLAGRLTQVPSAELDRLCREFSRVTGMRVTVILPAGKVIGESSVDESVMDNHADRPEVQQALRGKVGQSTRDSATLKAGRMYVAVPVYDDGPMIAVVRTSFPISMSLRKLHIVNARIAMAGLLAICIGAVASLIVARRISRPFEVIRHAAERFASGELNHRVPALGAEEVRMVAQSLNTMAEQLHQRIMRIVEQDNEHQAVLLSMEEGVLALDQNARVLNLNDSCCSLLGIDKHIAKGRSVRTIIFKTSFLEFINRTLTSPHPIEEDFELDGLGNRILHARGAALHDAGQHEIGALIVLHDVTRLRHLENVRRDFVANVSHELRTPITSIKGFVETLLHEELADHEQSLRFLEIVLKQVNRLDAIINDLLLLSRVERVAGGQTIELRDERLVDVLRSAAEMCQQKAGQKDIAIQVDCDEHLFAAINAPLFEQAVVNLVDNAIKYSDRSSTVHVAAELRNDQIVLRVQDHGCGIPEHHLKRLFERFYRVDRARSRELGGTGLGLSIVKHIVSAHRGSVSVESAVGSGSTFSVVVPATVPEMSETPDDRPESTAHAAE
jgi:two-component system phosphate regulon sensor histidine kinase PhoR